MHRDIPGKQVTLRPALPGARLIWSHHPAAPWPMEGARPSNQARSCAHAEVSGPAGLGDMAGLSLPVMAASSFGGLGSGAKMKPVTMAAQKAFNLPAAVAESAPA